MPLRGGIHMDEHALSEKIRSVLGWVWRHPTALFYRAKYARAGYDPTQDFRGLEDMRRVPLLEKSELAQAPWRDMLFLPFRERTYITFTSGTTRSQPLALFRNREPREKCWAWLEGERAPELTRLLILMLPHTILKYHPLAERKGMIPVMGDIANLANTARLARHFEVDGLHTLPGIALKIVPYLGSAYDCARFKVVSTVGEKVTQEKKALLRRAYPNAAIYSYYSSAETGTMGYQCRVIGESLNGNIYHFDQTKFFPEAITPAATAQARREGGELVVTHLRQAVAPLIRFRTGDSAVFFTEPCACGDTNPLVRIEGRSGFDMVRSGGFELRLESFEEAVRGLDQTLHFQFQVEVSEIAQNGAVIPRIFWQLLPRQHPLSAAAENSIAQILMRNTRLSARYTLEEAVAVGLMAMPAFSFSNAPPDSYKSPGLRFVES